MVFSAVPISARAKLKLKNLKQCTYNMCHCHLPAKHECCVLQGSVEIIQVRWEMFTSRYGKLNQDNKY